MQGGCEAGRQGGKDKGRQGGREAGGKVLLQLNPKHLQRQALTHCSTCEFGACDLDALKPICKVRHPLKMLDLR